MPLCAVRFAELAQRRDENRLAEYDLATTFRVNGYRVNREALGELQLAKVDEAESKRYAEPRN